MEVGRSRLRQSDGEVLGTVQIVNSNVWEKYEIQAQIRMVSRQSILHIEDTEILTYCHSHLSRKNYG